MSEERAMTPSEGTEPQEAWLDGYRAALADAIAMVDSLGAHGFANLSSPVLLRIKTRLIELQAGVDHPAAAA